MWRIKQYKLIMNKINFFWQKNFKIKAKEKDIKEQEKTKKIKILNTKKDALIVALKNQRLVKDSFFLIFLVLFKL